MTKEDILARSRAEGKDEMEIAVNLKAYWWGTMAIVITGFFFVGLKVMSNGIIFFEFPIMIFTYLIGMNIYNYLKVKNNKNLFAGFGVLFAFMCMIILYFLSRV